MTALLLKAMQKIFARSLIKTAFQAVFIIYYANIGKPDFVGCV